MTVAGNSKYFSTAKNGPSRFLRIANHRGTAEWFLINNHPKDNFGIVIKMEPKRFIAHELVEYREEVFFWDDLDAELEIGIAKGLIDWIESGNYTGPQGNDTDWSPSGRIDHNRPPRTRIAAQGNLSQPTTPPTTPPTGPDESTPFEESLTKYFRGCENMKYKVLKENALRELQSQDNDGTMGDGLGTYDELDTYEGDEYEDDESKELHQSLYDQRGNFEGWREGDYEQYKEDYDEYRRLRSEFARSLSPRQRDMLDMVARKSVALLRPYVIDCPAADRLLNSTTFFN